MQKFLLLTLLFAGFSMQAMGQTPRIDSLRKELGKVKADSIKVHDRIRISWYLTEIKDSLSWRYIREADSIADKTKNPVLKGIVYEHMGFLSNCQLSKKAITYYLQSESILKHFPNSLAARKSMASLALNIGIEHMNVLDDVNALNYFLEGVKRYEALDTMNNNLPILLGNIVNSYYNLGKYKAALSYCQQAYYKSFSTGRDVARIVACLNYGRVLLKLKEPEKAAVYLLQGKLIADTTHNYLFQSKYYQVMAMNSYEEKNYAEALDYMKKALPLIRQAYTPYDVSTTYNWLGICYLELGDFKPAAENLDSAFNIASRNGYLQVVKDIYQNKSRLERMRGNMNTAFQFLDSFTIMKDSLQHQSDADRLEFLAAKYQGERKEAQILQLQSDREIQRLNLQRKTAVNSALIISAVILVLFTGLLYRNFRQKQKIHQQQLLEMEAEKKLSATEAILKGEEQERTRLAKDLHDGLGGILSGIKFSFQTMRGNLVMTADNQQAFERSMDMLDSSIKEMRRVAHNMMPEALVKFGLDTALKDFCEDINQSGALQVVYQSFGMENVQVEQTAAIAIYRIVQELLNNTMKHAAARTAIVQLSKTADGMNITVEDDGKGFDPVILNNAKGIGWNNIQSRVEYLKGKMDVLSAPGKGTSVNIELNTLWQ
jgi:signal transduction histidine kinase